MKQITINGKVYDIDCNALTYVKYKSIFKTGILVDMQFIQNYLIKQALISQELEKNGEDLEELSKYMSNDVDEFIIKITQIAWILIYTADKKIPEYEEWLKSIERINTSDEWISEVTEFAVDCFR